MLIEMAIYNSIEFLFVTGLCILGYLQVDFRTTISVLSNSQILSLPTAPVVVVAPPGIGRAIIPIFAVLKLDNRGGNYGNFSITTANKKLYLGTGSDLAGLGTARSGCLTGSDLNTFFGDSLEEKTLLLTPFSDFNSGFTSLAIRWSNTNDNKVTKLRLDNQPLKLIAKNDPNGNYTGGEVGNKLFVKVYYFISDDTEMSNS
jgi:hypothetical protein